MSRVRYFDVGQWPIYVGFVNDEAAFKREMKRIKAGDVNFAASNHADASTISMIDEDGVLCVFVTLGSIKGKTFAQIAGLIAHEATHVAQSLWEHIGETNPSRETEAYFIQFVTQSCLECLDPFACNFALEG